MSRKKVNTGDKSGIPLPDKKVELFKKVGAIGGGFFLLVAIVLSFYGVAYAGWFTSDEVPPDITIKTPTEGAEYEDEITVVVVVSDDSRLTDVSILLDEIDYTPDIDLKRDKKKALTFKLKLDTKLLIDGKHELKVVAADKSANESDVAVTFYTDNTPTVVTLEFKPNRVDQGRVLGVYLNSNEKLYDLKGYLWEQEFPFWEAEDGYTSLLAVRASCPIGEYEITITGTDVADKEVVYKGMLNVVDGGYIKEYIEIYDSGKKKLFDPALEERKQREYATIQKVIKTWTDEQYWAGKFIYPTKGKYTSPFGTYRTFSTGSTERHLGFDIAAKEGTPIRAANRGVVAYAGTMIVRGNFVAINHGKGVYTLYNHMSAFAVREGESVEKGQVIGFIGSTGLSTGPHVHWEMRVFKWVTDPVQWTTEEFTYRLPADEIVAKEQAEKKYLTMLDAPIPPKIDPKTMLTEDVEGTETDVIDDIVFDDSIPGDDINISDGGLLDIGDD